MANRFDINLNAAARLGISPATSGGVATAALSSAYTFGSAGAAAGYRFMATTTANLSAVSFFSSALTGSPTTVTVEVRNASASATIPGTSLLGSQTVTLSSTANKWTEAVFSSPVAVTAGTIYWISIYNSNGSPTVNYPTISASTSIFMVSGLITVFTTANGWSTSTASTGPCPIIAIKYDDGTITGNAYVSGGAQTTNTLRRGLKITGLDGPVSISGVIFATQTNFNTLELYQGTQAPGSPTQTLATFSASSNLIASGIVFPSVTLKPGFIYRIVSTVSATSTAPNYWSNPDNSIADVESCLFGGSGSGNWCYTQDNGSGGWTDTADWIPRMQLLISDFVSSGVIVIDD